MDLFTVLIQVSITVSNCDEKVLYNGFKLKPRPYLHINQAFKEIITVWRFLSHIKTESTNVYLSRGISVVKSRGETLDRSWFYNCDKKEKITGKNGDL